MSDEPLKNLNGRDRLTRLADLVFEAGMLRRTPRSGYQFLGTGQENVAEHSFRTAMIGWMLAMRAGADAGHVAVMCLFHDLHEARTGDFNYVNKLYNGTDAGEALAHALSGTGLEEDVLPLWEELEAADTLESRLAQDADQIDFIANLKEQLDLGNRYAGDWIPPALERLRTEQGRELAKTIVETDHKEWWFLGPDRQWWAKKNGRRRTD
ncbi:metal dependent phosphohydrolase [Paucidesulfovibrio gracilis DSM 16080]|uniref:5'-deoxynucleotidase n=1 Tax=Paucidesulfovibrio gracilis DSM 16080 TaxID=1121449 RepID=A0A1T4XM49_9BACT|nr:HD domain-containing protein [Paucidesulfovibrio gracilis]SKA90238.1 metal dependent phosphohydrolase [Paucidesulfovibrio gracilis DSM 16080]